MNALKTAALNAQSHVVVDATGEEYAVSGLLYESGKSLIYRAERTNTKDAVIIKLINPEVQTPQTVARQRREYELIKTLDIPGVRRCVALTEINGGAALVLADVGGSPLRSLLETNLLTLPQTLNIFIELCSTVAAIHTHGVIHKDINPANVLVHPDSHAVYLIDFDIAARLTREQVDFGTVETIEGTLAYVSPEQTGRTGHPLDERTDLYSIGATLYEALTASPAFFGDTPIDLVYAHLARVPKPPHELDNHIPPILSQLIMKLLAKDPSARYKSALGVKYDLMEIRRRLSGKTTGNKAHKEAFSAATSSRNLTLVAPVTAEDPELVLGMKDAPLRLNIAQKIYGREDQRSQLKADFEYAESGGSAISLIAGSSGSGKTSLIMELASSILRTRATFVTGKFEELRRDIPYDAIIRALRGYVIGLNSASNEEIQSFTSAVVDAVSPNCQVLVDAISELGPLLGPQPPLALLNPKEQKNRFQQSFAGLIKAILHSGHPLVLFMDDLQWADFASIDLIGQFILDSALGRILLIGAYRDNEVSKVHPLAVALDKWAQSDLRISTINLAPMNLDAINELCTDTLQLADAATRPLAQIILTKTGGNPFFVHQFLRVLYRDRYINFDVEQGCWVFAIEQILLAPLTANIIELLTTRICDLSAEALTILTFASCLGGIFDLYTLAKAMDKPLRDVARGLNSAIHDDLIIPIGDGYRYIDAFLNLPSTSGESLLSEGKSVKYRFAHDRVREASYLSLSESQRIEIRLKVGRTLKGSKGQVLSDDELMGALNHLNAAESLIADKAERLEVAAMNCRAGRRAESASAWTIAAVLYQNGIRFLPPEAWTLAYELTRSLHLGSGTCDTLSGAFTTAEATFELLLKKSQDNISTAQIQHLRCILYITMQKNSQAIDVGLAGLHTLGIGVSKYHYVISDVMHIFLTRFRLSRFTTDEIINLPRSEDPFDELVIKMLMDLAEPCLLINQTLAAKVICLQVDYTLKHGINRYSAYGFLQMACVINGGSVVTGIQLWSQGEVIKLCQIWQAILAMWPAVSFNDRQQFAWTLICSHWEDAVGTHIRDLTALVPRFVAAGDISYTLYTLCTFIDHSQILGENLSDLVDRTSAFFDYTRNLKFGNYIGALQQLHGSISLLSTTDDAANLIKYAESIPVDRPPKGSDMTTYCTNLMLKNTLLYITGDYERALEPLVSCHNIQIDRVFVGTIKIAWFYTCLAMAIGQVFKKLAWYKKPYYLYLFIRARIVLNIYHKMSARNFRHHWLITKAMGRKIMGQPLSSYHNLLEEATTCAQQAGFNNCAAYAAEILGKELLQSQQYEMAFGPLMTARYAYRHWGVRTKIHELDAILAEEYGNVMETELTPTTAHSSHQTSTGRHFPSKIPKNVTTSIDGSITQTTLGKREASSLDAPTLIRAAQALSGEIHLQELKKKMMRLVCENAGARAAHLLMSVDDARGIEDTVSSDHLKIVTSARIGDDIIVEIGTRDPSADILSTQAVQFVVRTKEQLIIGDALNDTGWRDDKSLKVRHVRSVLCVPIIAGGSMKGILYLENELIPQAFTQERVELLGMLSGQMAISLENATLYAKLEASLHSERQARAMELVAHEDYVKAEGARQILSANIEAARAVQESLLFVTGDIPHIKLAQFYRPAERAGGDWFACYYDPRQQYVYLFLGDVTGHGVSTALVTAAAAGAAASAIAQVIAEPRSLAASLDHVGIAINEAVKRTGTPSKRMMTMTMVGIDIKTGQGHYLNAGQTPVMHLGAVCHEILVPGNPLGVDDSPSFGTREFVLAPGDQLFLFSDGLIENRDAKNIALSRANLRHILREIEDPDKIVAQLTSVVDSFVVDPRTDDTAFIAFQWLGFTEFPTSD